jgi:hemolysin type calcium-binding protein
MRLAGNDTNVTRTQRRRGALAALLGLVAVGLIAPALVGATVSVSVNKATHKLEITDVSGVNDVIVLHPEGEIFVVESTQPLTRGQGCDPSSPIPGRSTATCHDPDFKGSLVTLGAGSDDWAVLPNTHAGPPNPIVASGGPGNDVIRGGHDDDTLDGGEGDDQLLAGSGFDTLNGGAGNDSLSDDDNPSVSSRDTLRGGPDADTFVIRGGDDTVNGEAGNDVIFDEDLAQRSDTIDGGPDSDRWLLERSAGVSIRDGDTATNVFHEVAFKSEAELEDTLTNVERLDATNGSDVITGALRTVKAERAYNGRGGPDAVVGSPQTDEILGGNGGDRLFGRDGNDTLDAKAGEPVAVPDEVIDCGGGTDNALIDLVDPDPLGCEVVARSAIGEGPHVRIGSARRVRGRTFAVRLGCPRKLKHRCKGSLELALTERGLRPAKGTRYSIKAGRRRTVRLRLARRDARRLRTRGSSRGFVRSIEKGDVAGKKTTLALRRLTRRGGKS